LTLEQLHLYLGHLIAWGADRQMLVCIPADDSPTEIDFIEIASGIHLGEPRPKMGGSPIVENEFLLLAAARSTDLNGLGKSFTLQDTPGPPASVAALDDVRFARVWGDKFKGANK
jgi:hypothetical protein